MKMILSVLFWCGVGIISALCLVGVLFLCIVVAIVLEHVGIFY